MNIFWLEFVKLTGQSWYRACFDSELSYIQRLVAFAEDVKSI